LIVWYDEVNLPVGFQLCYGKEKSERALTWNAPAKYNHMAVDDGEVERSTIGRRQSSSLTVTLTHQRYVKRSFARVLSCHAILLT
jgi:hypothetical protein